MALEPVVYRVGSFVPNTVTESAELYAEQLEEIPYPLGMSEYTSGSNWPPAGFSGVAVTASTTSNTASLLPQAFNLEWVQGDTAEFQFLFTDVFWVIDDPSVETPLYANTSKVITNKALTSDVATLTASSHGYSAGFSVTVSGVGTPFDGVHTITSVTTNTFSYATANDIAYTTATGTVTKTPNTFNITNKSLTSQVVTLTTSAAHGFSVGNSVVVSGVGTPFNGTFTVTAVPSTTTFSYTASNDVSSSEVTPNGAVVVTNMPVWGATEWAAQVRNPYIYSTYASDYWVPAYGYQYNWWRGNSTIAEFSSIADIVEVPNTTPTQWATRVTLTISAANSAAILPGNWYRWDLQTRTIDDVVKTHLRGKTRIITEWTVR